MSAGSNDDAQKLKHRAIKVSDELWFAAMSRATAEDRNLSQIIRDCLRDYVAKDPRLPPTT